MLPVLPGANMGFSFVHVDDVARGHVLAAEKGKIGESYLLGGEVMTLGDAVQVIARLAGMPAPLLLLDDKLPHALEAVAGWLERFVTLPQLFSAEVLRMMGCTWMFTSAKAKRELGYTYRPFEDGIAETIQWELLQRRTHPPRWAIPLALIGAASSLAILWFWRRRRHS
jgi:dihydroflavonol-4-reductase